MILQFLTSKTVPKTCAKLLLPTLYSCAKWLAGAGLFVVIAGCQNSIGRTNLQDAPVNKIQAKDAFARSTSALDNSATGSQSTTQLASVGSDSDQHSWLKKTCTGKS